MNTLAHVGLFFGGLAALVLGGSALVRGGSALAARLGIAPLVVGLTVVARGTSARTGASARVSTPTRLV